MAHKYTDIELARINKARLRPIELSEAQFAYEKKIGRYNPADYTFMKFNPGNVEDIAPVQEETEPVKTLKTRRDRQPDVEQLDLFAFGYPSAGDSLR